MTYRKTGLPARIACVLAAFGAASAGAEDLAELPRYSLTPFGGYTFGGEFSDRDDGAVTADVDDAAHFGVAFNIRESANTQWEVFYARQGSDVDTTGLVAEGGRIDLDVQYLHLGGTYVGDGGFSRPYLAAGLGVTRFDPDPLRFDSRNFFSFSLGGGWMLQASERLGLRLEARALGTFIRSDTALFCETGPEETICAIAGDSELFWQIQTSLGVVLRF